MRRGGMKPLVDCDLETRSQLARSLPGYHRGHLPGKSRQLLRCSRWRLVAAAPLLDPLREPFVVPAARRGEMKLLVDCDLELSNQLARSLPGDH